MPILDLGIDRIDDFLQRLDIACQLHILLYESLHRHIDDFSDRIHVDLYFILRFLRKYSALAIHLRRGFADIFGVV